MEINRLSHFIELPETHREILSGYEGTYSLGIGRDDARGEKLVLILQVEQKGAARFPKEIRLDNEVVPVVVRTGFVVPRALAARVR